MTVPSRGTQELECLDLRSAHHLGLWQTLCCPFTTRAPHKSQRYLFAVFLPLHNTTEQMTLNRIYYCPFLSGLRLDIEETCKQRRPAYVKIRQESHSKSCRFRRLKSSSKIAFKDNCRLWEKVQARTRENLTLNWPHNIFFFLIFLFHYVFGLFYIIHLGVQILV